MYMTSGAERALKDFNTLEEKRQMKEAFESRMYFIESVYRLLAIGLQENREQYINMEDTFAKGEKTYLFDHYVLASDSDERFVQQGESYRPAFLVRCVNTGQVTPSHQVSTTKEILLAIPVQENLDITNTTSIEDIELHESSVFVYWHMDDSHRECYEISAHGVRSASTDNDAQSIQALLEHVTAQDFSAFDTAAALVARLRQDLRNLQLVPHFSVIVDDTGNELFRQT